jgi:hypothetical protein
MSARPFAHPAMIQGTIIICLLLAPFCAASNHKEYEDTRDEVRDFAGGGMVHVRLGVGDLRIVRGDSDKIRVHYTVKSDRESKLQDARLAFEVRSHDANIEFHAPRSGNTQFDVEIEVPPNTNLDVHDKVGDLTVTDIDGDKDLNLGVGDVRVEEERTAYHFVQASTSIGDVNGNAYGESSGWLDKTLKYHGDGKYELHAHVSVGDITLEGK